MITISKPPAIAIGLMAWLVASCFSAEPPKAEPANPVVRLTTEPGHPWTPPFGLDRVGRPFDAVVEAPDGVQPDAEYSVVGYRDGRETGRRAVKIMDPSRKRYGWDKSKLPWFGRVTLDDWPSEVALVVRTQAQVAAVEIARVAVKPPMFEAEAVARPDRVIHPVDLGTILVPNGSLLLGGGQRATVMVAALNRGAGIAGARVSAWYESTPAEKIHADLALVRGNKAQAELAIGPHAGTAGQDRLWVAITDGDGKELWKKVIPVMVVAKPPAVPRFGAVETKLRYDGRIPTRLAPEGIKYQEGWDPKLNDVVVFFPNGARFVLWRGASYCPFWASRSNTGLCYEWAEINGAKHQVGRQDCVEPLQDKELRYGRVKIVESTPARVHVRWDYQSCDLEYRVWGEFASEDYYFYPDGFGTRVMTVTSRKGSPLENQEFIILLPQSAYPLEYLPTAAVDLIWPEGKATFRFPCRPGVDGQEDQWAGLKATGKEVALLHRLRFGKDEPLAAIQYSPMGSRHDLPGYRPMDDRGAEVTQMYWGHHWPLSRGYPTGWTISDRVHETPGHVAAYHSGSPKPLREQTAPLQNALGETHEMTRQTFFWLIGATDADDAGLRHWMQSINQPPGIKLSGARQDTEFSAPERRALCLVAEAGTVKITINPEGRCINPVFEIRNAPKKLRGVSLAGTDLTPDRYAWDGTTFWLSATIEQPSVLQLEFAEPE